MLTAFLPLAFQPQPDLDLLLILMPYDSSVLAHGRPAKIILLSSATKTADSALQYVKTGDLSAAPEDFQAGFGKNGQPEDVEVRDKSNGGAGEVSGTEIQFKRCDVSWKELKNYASIAKHAYGGQKLTILVFPILPTSVNSSPTSKPSSRLLKKSPKRTTELIWYGCSLF